jgi:hypothetical protein
VKPWRQAALRAGLKFESECPAGEGAAQALRDGRPEEIEPHADQSGTIELGQTGQIGLPGHAATSRATR